MRLGRIMLMHFIAAVNQLSYTPLFMLFSAMGGDAVITCCKARRDWLQQLCLMNNCWHLQHYANDLAWVVQVLKRPVSLFYFVLAQSGKIVAQFLRKSFLFYFTLLQMGKRL